MHSFLFDKETQDLAEFRPKGMSIPPADKFIRIDGASPFFRLSDIVVYHEGLAEVPWIEANTPGHGTIHGNIQVGSFIQLVDDELHHQSQGLNSPKVYGRIKEFIGYDGIYAVAVVLVMTYYWGYGDERVSYRSGKPWPFEQHGTEETIIFLQQGHCSFPSIRLLEYSPGEINGHRVFQYSSEEDSMEWGPRRPWDGKEDWKHPGVRQKEEKGEGEKYWAKREECGQEGLLG